MKFNTSYLHAIYEDPKYYKSLITRMTNTLKKLREKTPFDAIAFTGTSGAAVAYPLSVRMGIPLICVRKENKTQHHSYLQVEGCSEHEVKRYIIVDDFISSGDTIRNIINKIDSYTLYHSTYCEHPPAPTKINACPKYIKCVGIVLYNGDGDDHQFEGIPVTYVPYWLSRSKR